MNEAHEKTDHIEFTITAERISMDEVVILANATNDMGECVLEGGPQRVWLRKGDTIHLNFEVLEIVEIE